MNVAFNPFQLTNAAGTFFTSSDGLVVGTAMDDPATRFALAGGILDSGETLPMWGGVGIEELIPDAGSQLGGRIARAADFAHLTGFSVFDQASSMVNSPQSPVPVAMVGMGVHFYRFGSNARIVVACDASLASNDGSIITTAVDWDFTNQKIVPHGAGTALPVKILKILAANCKTVSYNSGTGVATWNQNGACALIQI